MLRGTNMVNRISKNKAMLVLALALVVVVIGMPLASFASHKTTVYATNVFGGSVGTGDALYDVVIKVSPNSIVPTCDSTYEDRTLTEGDYEFIVPYSNLYPGKNTIEVRGYDIEGNLVHYKAGVFMNDKSQNCLNPSQDEQWKVWRYEMFGEMARDANDKILRYPAHNPAKRESVNDDLREWLILKGMATPSEIAPGTQLIENIIALDNGYDEVQIWMLSDQLMDIMGAEDQPNVWSTRKYRLVASGAETGFEAADRLHAELIPPTFPSSPLFP
jgi:hypothetical protein